MILTNLLWILLAIPVVASAVVAALGPRPTVAIRWISLTATLACALLAFILAADLHAHVAPALPPRSADLAALPTFAPSYVTRVSLLPLGPGAVEFFIGLDGLNVWLVVLTAVLMVPAVLVSWHSFQVQERINEYFAWLLALETGMIGVFLSFDIVLFYVFFELTLVPLFFLIGIWGGPERRYAARKFFIYTLTGSLITLLGVLGVVLFCYLEEGELTFSIPRLLQLANGLYIRDGAVHDSYGNFQFWVFLALMAGFAIKVPLVPFHTWLPLAHVEAPTAGSVLLAGVLLKIGAYGFLRLCVPLAPDASLTLGVPLIGALAVIGIIYGAICALAQEDFKKLVAYSSVSHLGFCMLGMFALNLTGLSGSLLEMINHGLSTGALFLLVGMLYERYHTRQMHDYGGLGARLHLLACFMVFTCLSSLGLPGLNGFVGEALVFFGMFEFRPVYAIVGTAGILLGAWYLLRLLLRVFFGPVKEPEHAGHGPILDLNFRELAALVPIALLCLLIGIYPQPILDTSNRDLSVVAQLTAAAKDRQSRRDGLARRSQSAKDQEQTAAVILEGRKSQ
ncbi:MAG TPA: NADH-quinone oxidoreductase subunit M [Gemmataceae bacterium]|nr:NADH-quinone oxidoreductase subunit M [Gemmataceae bacterium]